MEPEVQSGAYSRSKAFQGNAIADQSFEEFMEQQRPSVAAAFVNGDPGPLREISATADPATFYGPDGGVEHGSAHVLAGNEKAAKQFQHWRKPRRRVSSRAS